MAFKFRRRSSQLLILIISLLSVSCSSNPKDIFEDRTGLKIDQPIFGIKETDTYGIHEGEYSIVFRSTEGQIKTWLKGNPPWNNKKWNKGAIPHVMGGAFQLNFPESVGLAFPDKGTPFYMGDKGLVKLLNDTSNYYSYIEDCCPKDNKLRFHDGRILIIQPQTKMVYYAVWDY